MSSHRRHQPGALPRPSGERGTGLLASIAGVAVFLLVLLFAVQLLVNLYATSTVTAAGLDAARIVAAKDVDHDDAGAVRAAQVLAESRFRSLLGSAADRAVLTWAVDATTVRLRVVVQTPTILPRSLGHQVAFGQIDRTFEVHVEELR